MFILKQFRCAGMTNVRYRVVGLAIMLAAFLLMFPHRTSAQESSPPPTQEPDSSTTTSPDSPQEPGPDQPTTSTVEPGAAGGGSSRIVALRWGHLSAFSVDTFYVYDTNYRNSAFNPQGESAFSARIIAFYSVGNDRLGLDVQYRPDMLVSQNNYDFEFGASLVNFHIHRPISQSWTFSLLDTFTYEPDFNFLNTPTISLTSTGAFNQQSLLLNGQTELRNVLSAGFTYRIAQHDHITFHAQDDYENLRNGPNSIESSALFYGSGNTAGGGVSYNHSIGPNHDVGVNYNYDREVFGGSSTQAQYHTIIVTYRQKIGRSILLQASGGPSFHVFSNGSATQKTFVGTADILKSFNQSSVALLYTRGYEFTGIITDSYHDRYDAFYSRIFQNIFGAEGGISYIQTHSTGLTQGIEGRIIFARLNYYLSHHWTLFATFQNSAFAGATQPYIGRNFITLGARWSYGGARDLQRP
jgi:hypothetical protein